MNQYYVPTGCASGRAYLLAQTAPAPADIRPGTKIMLILELR